MATFMQRQTAVHDILLADAAGCCLALWVHFGVSDPHKTILNDVGRIQDSGFCHKLNFLLRMIFVTDNRFWLFV